MTLQQPIQLTQMPPDSTTRSGIRQRGAEREVRRLIQSLTHRRRSRGRRSGSTRCRRHRAPSEPANAMR